jgi:hypothetical protein
MKGVGISTSAIENYKCLHFSRFNFNTSFRIVSSKSGQCVNKEEEREQLTIFKSFWQTQMLLMLKRLSRQFKFGYKWYV